MKGQGILGGRPAPSESEIRMKSSRLLPINQVPSNNDNWLMDFVPCACKGEVTSSPNETGK